MKKKYDKDPMKGFFDTSIFSQGSVFTQKSIVATLV